MLQIFRRRLAAGLAPAPRYPRVADETPPGFRGMPDLLEGACRGAGDCATVCPTLAIRVEHQGADWTWRLDRAACIGCGLCMEACPFQALEASRAFELASRSRADLVETVHFRGGPKVVAS
jgi:formate hydrogenlyase subunit 6/NADH:ubiquinone oxidoreductase subunit I